MPDMYKTVSSDFPQYVSETALEKWLRDGLLLLKLGNAHDLLMNKRHYPIRLETSLLILTLSGEITIVADYHTHRLTKNTVIQLVVDDIIDNITYTSDFEGYLFLFSSRLKAEIRAQLSGGSMPKLNRLKRSYPIQQLNDDECRDITGRIERIGKYIADEMHVYRSHMIRSEVACLQMELGNIRQINHGEDVSKPSRNEVLRERFWELLLKECRRHRNVNYYAQKLCVTSDHLSKVIRDYDGQSAMKWVVNAVVTEAKILLRQPDITINQIAAELNFPDQSTFGKFFKRYTRQSPKQFRKQMQELIG